MLASDVDLVLTGRALACAEGLDALKRILGSDASIGRSTGVDRSTVRAWRSGRAMPNPEHARALGQLGRELIPLD